MSMLYKNGTLRPAHMLYPLGLLALVLFLTLAFQTMQILRDRGILHNAQAQQDKPLEETQKVKAQVDALAVGTLKLAQQGNKNARGIIERMKELGITVVAPIAPSPAAMPANSDSPVVPLQP